MGQLLLFDSWWALQPASLERAAPCKRIAAQRFQLLQHGATWPTVVRHVHPQVLRHVDLLTTELVLLILARFRAVAFGAGNYPHAYG